MLDLTNLKDILEKKKADYPSFPDETVISNITNNLSFLANFIPADIHLYQLSDKETVKTVGEAKPTVEDSFYRRSYMDYSFFLIEKKIFKDVVDTNNMIIGCNGDIINELPCHQSVFPVFNIKKNIIALLEVERNINEELRSGAKQEIYREIIESITKTIIDKALYETRSLPSFLPGDAFLIINDTGLIIYANPVMLSIAKMFNIQSSLEGNAFSDFFSTEDIVVKDMNYLYIEQNITLNDITLNLKTIPLASYVIVILRDITQLHRKEIEISVKSMIIKEVHHRVKNNLQTIVGLLRLQQRRSKNEDAKNILGESINRINSIALVHEYLSQKDVELVNLKDLTSNILLAIIQSIGAPDIKIETEVFATPDLIFLPASMANSISLILNELINNTVKHAFSDNLQGKMTILLNLSNNLLKITIKDNGKGLPKNFDPEKHANLGWRIILNLLIDALMGDYEINSDENGTTITITVPGIA